MPSFAAWADAARSMPPPRLFEEIVRVDLVDARHAGDEHGAGELVADAVIDALDAHRAAEGEAVENRPTERDGIGAKRQRLEDVGAATNAAIHDHRHAPVDGGDDRRQKVDRGGNAIEAAPAVI